MGVLEAGEYQPEVIEPVIEPLARDRNAEAAGVGEVGEPLPSRLMLLTEDAKKPVMLRQRFRICRLRSGGLTCASARICCSFMLSNWIWRFTWRRCARCCGWRARCAFFRCSI